MQLARLGGIPIDYHHQDFVQEIQRLTSEGVDVVFDGIGDTHIWRSRKALRQGGKVVAYGLTSSLQGDDWLQVVPVIVTAFMESPFSASILLAACFSRGKKRVVPYSIQWLNRLRPGWFRQDLIALFDLRQQRKIKPVIAQRFPLGQARQAHELLGKEA